MKTDQSKKLGLKSGMLIAGVVCMLVVTTGFMPSLQMDDETGKARILFEGSFACAENTPGSGESGFLAIFGLDYAQNPATVLQNNATDWSSSANVNWYADEDSFNEDPISEDPFYFVVRLRCNKSMCWDTDKFIDSRVRCKLTVSGDETISNVLGTAVVSQNSTDDDFIWINFYWDDGSDGYRVTDAGTITISAITPEAYYGD